MTDMWPGTVWPQLPESALSPRPIRTRFYRGFDLNNVADEPLVKSLLKYRRGRDRTELKCICNAPGPDKDGRWWHKPDCPAKDYTLTSSEWSDGKYRPMLDLDYPHVYTISTQEHHGHLYMLTPTSRFRWTVLMLALWFSGQQELGYVVWSIRRGSNFLRKPGLSKTPEELARTYEPVKFGWFMRRRLKDFDA